MVALIGFSIVLLTIAFYAYWAAVLLLNKMSSLTPLEKVDTNRLEIVGWVTALIVGGNVCVLGTSFFIREALRMYYQ